MVDVVFYEKPGCINNSKQKKLLLDAGHRLQCRNLLTEPWEWQTLSRFFQGLPVSAWFNGSAPDIKSGLVDPATLDEDRALALMIKNPLLIRRPLMRVGDEYRVGFDSAQVHQWIGLQRVNPGDDLESCPKKTTHQCTLPA
jgi:nitrogenase-associated protein